MPNQITALGLETAPYSELYGDYTSELLLIYGAGSDFSSTTPDGQWINNIVQEVIDLQNFITQVNAMFDPDQAVGNILDLRVAINGIQRQGATFTVTPISITNGQSVNLYGLDQSAQPVYTVQDNAGNQYQLQQTQLGQTAGTYSLQFQAVTPGAVIPIPNTITTPVSIVLGVTAVNNPNSYTSLGQAEESDAALRLRRSQSVALSSQGYYNSLIAALLNVTGVTYAFVHENDTGSTDTTGTPGHSIWVIVAGNGTAADIAQAIYVKRNAGCGMYNSGDSGAQSFAVTQADGSSFTVYWDDVITIPVYVKFTASSLNKTVPPNIAAIQAGLDSVFEPGVASQVNINELASGVQDLDPNTLVTSAGFNTEQTQVITFSLTPTTGAFELTYGGTATSSIAWNASASTVQSDLRTISGLGSVTVSGSITSSSGLTVTMTGVTNPSMIGVESNTLVATATPVSLNFVSAFTSTLSPSALNNQFVALPANIIITPMMVAAPSGVTGIAYNINSTTGLVTNTTLSIPHTGTFTFLGIGGYSTLTYSLTTSTGSTINTSSGAYVAGSAGTDTVTVTDTLGNSAFCTVTIT